ncbi:MAG: dihydroorotase family protein [Nitrososphaerota archaeon]|nr:dihydroorotase family protein [Nitrososphaerota archaeon]MDG6957920.1 dihydroorotase family protein [Nitrososphaerota archaeon]MDG6959252.1 dihydroorotase family protein [Nitrososphaerota archaeon]MDG6969101.1 dihydroorotase family protein [Nitrososphaerota archaeon]MDG6972018.1 dihydroorotase family protein [Nitrososphaerota archaeon]
MEHDLVLDGRVVTPEGPEDAEVGVTDGVIREIGHGLRGARRIRADGCLVFPGFVDAHVHLREPGWERKEGFRTGTMAAIHGGVTTVADMPNNPTPTTTPEALEEKSRLAAARALVEVKFYGGIARGSTESLVKLSPDVAGYKLYMSETTGARSFPAEELPRVFRLVAGTGKPLSIHCEDQDVIDGAAEKLSGVSRPDAYCDMRPPSSETEAVARVVRALEGEKGLSANVCHASLGETLSLVEGARREGLRLRCEATLHHAYFSRRAMLDNPLLRTNPPLRAEEDREALVQGLRLGRVSFLVTDHAPHLLEEKEEFGLAGVPGLDDYSHVVSWLMLSQRVDPAIVARVASFNPAKYLGLTDRGEVALGKRGDFTVIDLHAPEVARGDDVRSRCGWSPYEGREFPGRARWVVLGGEVLMDDFESVR